MQRSIDIVRGIWLERLGVFMKQAIRTVGVGPRHAVHRAEAADREGDDKGARAPGPRVAVGGIGGVELVAAVVCWERG